MNELKSDTKMPRWAKIYIICSLVIFISLLSGLGWLYSQSPGKLMTSSLSAGLTQQGILLSEDHKEFLTDLPAKLLTAREQGFLKRHEFRNIGMMLAEAAPELDQLPKKSQHSVINSIVAYINECIKSPGISPNDAYYDPSQKTVAERFTLPEE